MDDLGALLDLAIDAALTAGRRITGIALPSSTIFVFEPSGAGLRRVDRAEVLALVAATRTGRLFARVQVSVLGLHEGHTVLQLRETPMAALPSDVFKTSGVVLGRARSREDGTIDWTSPFTRAELEANGREAIEACSA